MATSKQKLVLKSQGKCRNLRWLVTCRFQMQFQHRKIIQIFALRPPTPTRQHHTPHEKPYVLITSSSLSLHQPTYTPPISEEESIEIMFSVSRSAFSNVLKRASVTPALSNINARCASNLASSLSTLKGQHFVSIDQLR